LRAAWLREKGILCPEGAFSAELLCLATTKKSSRKR